MNSKITNIPYLCSPEEKTEFFKLISYALMSQPATTNIIPRIKLNNKVYNLGKNIHHFAMKMMTIDTDEVNFVGCKIKTVKLWKVLKEYFDQLYGLAQAEAIAKSKEMPKGAESVREYVIGDEE